MEKTTEFHVGEVITEEKVQLTQEGFDNLKERHKELIEVIRPEILKELEAARDLGDLSENAEYDAAKNKQAETEAEIAKIEDIFSRVEIIAASRAKTISVGSTVVYKKAGESKQNKIQIVGSVEVDMMAEIPKVGANTPVAQAMLGAKEGDTVVVESSKSYEAKIIKVN